ncbi:DUF1648 domain-containing protein [Pseudopedobacter beijingensis]|uniref:DUF1648 domain-containing protein n=1 Tax=Pseudopedobacter beijingensis TaxID=1207056 RepID=A0ABW4IGJ5_9SPHI
MKKIDQPKIIIARNGKDKVIGLLCLLLVLFMWIIILVNLKTIPDNVPVHYNYQGKADLYSSKNAVFLIPVLGTLLYVGISILNHFPHKFNYPVKITKENAKTQYTIAVRMLSYVKLILLTLFAVIAYKTTLLTTESGHQTDSIGRWFLPVVLLILAFVVGIFVMKSKKILSANN